MRSRTAGCSSPGRSLSRREWIVALSARTITLLQPDTIGPGSGTVRGSTRAPRPPSAVTASASAAVTVASRPSA